MALHGPEHAESACTSEVQIIFHFIASSVNTVVPLLKDTSLIRRELFGSEFSDSMSLVLPVTKRRTPLYQDNQLAEGVSLLGGGGGD